MPYIEDRGGLDFNGNNPRKGYPVAIVERVLSLVSQQLGVPIDRLMPETRFVEDLGVDSGDDVELVIGTEEEFSIAISDEDAVQIITVGQLVQCVKDRAG